MNLSYANAKSYSFFIKATLVALVLLSLIINSYLMGMNPDGTMQHCIFAGTCKMNLSEHLNLWQGLFAATAQKVFSFDSLLLLLFAVVFMFIVIGKYTKLLLSHDFIYRFYYKQKQHLSFFDYLKEAFSQGILNSKIYNLAVI